MRKWIDFVVTLLPPSCSPLRAILQDKRSVSTKKKSRGCKEYGIHSVEWNHRMNEKEKRKGTKSQGTDFFIHSTYYTLASFFDPNKSSNNEFQISASSPGSFTFSICLIAIVDAAALTLFVRSYGFSSIA